MSVEQKNPIRGWLILFAIKLWLAPFYYFFIIIGGIYTLPPHILRTDIIIVHGFIGLIMSFYLLMLFIQRKAVFVKVLIFFLIYGVFLETAMLLTSIQLHKNLIPNFIGYLEIIVILLYVIRSKRVKRTFVK